MLIYMDKIAKNIDISRMITGSSTSTEMGVFIRSLGRLYEKSNYYCRDRSRDDYLLLLTLGGSAWVREGQRKRILAEGSWFLLRPGIVHSYRDISPWSFAYVHFGGNIINRTLYKMAFFERENIGFKQLHYAAHELLLRLIEKSGDITLSGEVLRNALLLELLSCLCADYCREYRVADPLAVARESLNDNLDKRPDLLALAKRAGMSRFHFIRCFKAKYGEPPIRYLNKARIEKAANMLLHESSRYKIHEIAATVGFKDPLYFSRIFKQFTGMSPEKFRVYAKQFAPV